MTLVEYVGDADSSLTSIKRRSEIVLLVLFRMRLFGIRGFATTGSSIDCHFCPW